MDLPSKVKVGGFDVPVLCVSYREMDAAADFKSWPLQIRVNQESYGRQHQQEALLHEIIEAIQVLNDLKIDHTVVSVLGMSLFQVLRDNPEVVRFILEELG